MKSSDACCVVACLPRCTPHAAAAVAVECPVASSAFWQQPQQQQQQQQLSDSDFRQLLQASYQAPTTAAAAIPTLLPLSVGACCSVMSLLSYSCTFPGTSTSPVSQVLKACCHSQAGGTCQVSSGWLLIRDFWCYSGQDLIYAQVGVYLAYRLYVYIYARSE